MRILQQQVKCGNIICVCASTNVAEKMDTDLNEVVSSVTAYIESYLANTDGLFIKYRNRLAPILTLFDSCHFTNTRWKI